MPAPKWRLEKNQPTEITVLFTRVVIVLYITKTKHCPIHYILLYIYRLDHSSY